MTKFSKIAIGLLLGVCGAAFAQSNAGKLTSVQGIVTINDGKSTFTAIPNSFIRDGYTITTGAGGAATYVTDSGCSVSMGPNQSIRVAPGNCQQLAALVGNVSPQAGAVAGSRISPAGAVFSGVIFLATLNEIRKVNKLSPS